MSHKQLATDGSTTVSAVVSFTRQMPRAEHRTKHAALIEGDRVWLAR